MNKIIKYTKKDKGVSLTILIVTIVIVLLVAGIATYSIVTLKIFNGKKQTFDLYKDANYVSSQPTDKEIKAGIRVSINNYASESRIIEIENQIKALNGTYTVTFFSKEDSLNQYKVLLPEGMLNGMEYIVEDSYIITFTDLSKYFEAQKEISTWTDIKATIINANIPVIINKNTSESRVIEIGKKISELDGIYSVNLVPQETLFNQLKEPFINNEQTLKNIEDLENSYKGLENYFPYTYVITFTDLLKSFEIQREISTWPDIKIIPSPF
ncbi:MAG: permease-like cell division protein FtsX [Oscillospiraceae bacterium]|nr:permease-like cell division protein FtsX [Oscillospiraceae bacterium]